MYDWCIYIDIGVCGYLCERECVCGGGIEEQRWRESLRI